MSIRAPVLMCLIASAASVRDAFWVCNAVADAEFRGKFELDADGWEDKASWTNARGKTIFAHGPFWYMGDMEGHPPATHYRGVVGCAGPRRNRPASRFRPRVRRRAPRRSSRKRPRSREAGSMFLGRVSTDSSQKWHERKAEGRPSTRAEDVAAPRRAPRTQPSA